MKVRTFLRTSDAQQKLGTLASTYIKHMRENSMWHVIALVVENFELTSELTFKSWLLLLIQIIHLITMRTTCVQFVAIFYKNLILPNVVANISALIVLPRRRERLTDVRIVRQNR